MTKIISTLRKEVLYGSLYKYIQIIQTCPHKAQGIESEKEDLEMLARVSRYITEAERHNFLRVCFQRTFNYGHNKQQRYVSGKSQNPWISNLLTIPCSYFSSVCEEYQRAIMLLVNQELWLPFGGNEWKQKKNGRCGTVSCGSHKEAAIKWKLLCDIHSPPERRREQCILSCTSPPQWGNSTNYWDRIGEERARMLLPSCLGQCKDG